MSLYDLAEADNAFLLEDDVSGFGKAVTVTDLDSRVYQLTGQVMRSGVDIDPGTGLLVPGDKTGVTLRLSRFDAENLPDEGWLVETTDSTGRTVKGKAAFVLLDRTAGRATFLLKR